jgi:hypothetical protein
VYVSPKGTRAVLGGFQFTEQQLVDADSLSVLETFKARGPKIIPGDVGWLEEGGQHTLLRMPGKKEVALSFASSTVFPENRFLDQGIVIGVKMLNVGEGKATAVKLDGTVLYQIEVKDAWRGYTHFVPSASGVRFCVTELYYTRLNSMVNFFDIADSRAYNRARMRVFEVAAGKQVFELKWHPRGYRGEDILPALSPSGHRLALVRKGKLQVYEVP